MYDDEDVDEITPVDTFDEDVDQKVHRSVVLLPMAGGKDAEYEERRARLLESFNTMWGMKADLRYYSNEEQIPELLNKYRKQWVQTLVVYPRFFG